MQRETTACLICRKPSKGAFATGHVKAARGEEVLATFCSLAHLRESDAKVDEKGSFGRWREWMGATETRA